MNNQLKLPWIQTYRETPQLPRPAFLTAALETVEHIKRSLRRNGQMRPSQELGRGYTEFVARHHTLR